MEGLPSFTTHLVDPSLFLANNDHIANLVDIAIESSSRRISVDFAHDPVLASRPKRLQVRVR